MTTHVLLWSKSQNCYHIEPLAELLKKNRAALVRDATLNDYHPVSVGTQEQMFAAADAWREVIRQRDAERAAES